MCRAGVPVKVVMKAVHGPRRRLSGCRFGYSALDHQGDAMPSKRETIEPHKGDKRYVRRDERGRFTESDDVSRSLSQDRRRKSKTVAKPGQGDKGDRKR
jgi:hypothetical protein